MGVLLAALFLAQGARAQCEPAIELISDRTQFPTRAAHAIAFTGSDLGLIKVQPSSGPVYFARYDLDFEPLTSDEIVADTFVAGSLDLFWTGMEFGLFYETTSTQLVLRRISAEGRTIGGPIVIPLRFGLSSREYGVAYDRTRGLYVIAHAVSRTADAGLWLTFVRPDGSVVREQRVSFFVSLESNPRVAVAGDGTIGVLYRQGIDGSQRLLRFVSETAPVQPETVIPTATGGREPHLAASEDVFAVLHRMVTMAGSTLTWVRVDTDGNIVSPERTLVSGPGIDVSAVDVFWNFDLDEWALAYITSRTGFASDPGEYRLRRFRSEADVIDDALFSPDPLRNVFLGRNNFVWTGRGYVSPADRPIAPSVTESYLLNYCPFQVLAESDRLNAATGTPVSFRASAAGGTPPYEYEWSFGDGRGATGQFVQHVYTAEGVYTVTVTTTDAKGATVTSSTTVSIVVPRRRPVRK